MLAMARERTGSDLLEGLREAPPLTEASLRGRFWQFTDLERGLLSPFLVLAPGGLVGNFFNASADCWQVIGGRLCLIGANGLPSIIFNVARVDGEEVSLLAGRGVIDGVTSLYMLIACDHPAHPMRSSQDIAERRAVFSVRPENGPKRPNLVVVPANSKSLHPRWFDGLASNTRSWDLCVGYYGAEAPVVDSSYEYLAHLPGRKKFQLISDLFHDDSPLWGYDRIWLPDDDLLCDGQDINRMFHISRKYELDLAQPALRDIEGCHINHPITAQRSESEVRMVPFVEIMCPLFSKQALEICIGSVRDSISGYGLDHLWPSFLGKPASRMGIIDATGVVHTRPIGASYDVRGAIGEQAALWNAYGFKYAPIAGVR